MKEKKLTVYDGTLLNNFNVLFCKLQLATKLCGFIYNFFVLSFKIYIYTYIA